MELYSVTKRHGEGVYVMTQTDSYRILKRKFLKNTYSAIPFLLRNANQN